MADLDSYFDRIGHAVPRAATLDVLRALHAAHPNAIPFENLDPLLGRPIELGPAALHGKLVAGRRGGYCFEQNTLFASVLSALGFAVTPLVARVRWILEPGQTDGPRAHMLLRIDLDGTIWIADVGFGAFVLDAPLRLVADEEQAVPNGVVRFVRENDARWVLQARLPQGWRSAYVFTLEPALPADYEVANWFMSTNPESLFRGNLLMERVAPEGRWSLFNRRLTLRRPDGTAEERSLVDSTTLGETLESVFGVAPPAAPADIWARIPA